MSHNIAIVVGPISGVAPACKGAAIAAQARLENEFGTRFHPDPGWAQ